MKQTSGVKKKGVCLSKMNPIIGNSNAVDSNTWCNFIQTSSGTRSMIDPCSFWRANGIVREGQWKVFVACRWWMQLLLSYIGQAVNTHTHGRLYLKWELKVRLWRWMRVRFAGHATFWACHAAGKQTPIENPLNLQRLPESEKQYGKLCLCFNYFKPASYPNHS